MHFRNPDAGWSFGWLWHNIDTIFVPYIVGGILPGLAASVAAYFVVRPLVAAYQARRRLKLMERAKERMRQAAERRKAAKEARSQAGADDPAR